jgi:hypothetical protein
MPHIRQPLLPLRQRVAKVRACDAHPALLHLDADAASVQCGGLDERCADAAHRVDDEIARQ